MTTDEQYVLHWFGCRTGDSNGYISYSETDASFKRTVKRLEQQGKLEIHENKARLKRESPSRPSRHRRHFTG